MRLQAAGIMVSLVATAGAAQDVSPAAMVDLCGGYRMELRVDGAPDAGQLAGIVHVLDRRLSDGPLSFLARVAHDRLNGITVTDAGLIVVERVGRTSLGLDPAVFLARGDVIGVFDVVEDRTEALTNAGERVLDDPDGRPVVVAVDPLIAELSLVEASLGVDTTGMAVDIRLTEEASRQFAQVTADRVGQQLALVVDDTLLTAPYVQTVIGGGALIITGDFTQSEARTLAQRLDAGSLRYDVTVDHEMIIAPQDGASERCAGVPVQE